MMCYSIGRTSGLLIGPLVLCDFHWWFARSSNVTLRTLYLALVRSQLEYCSVVWSPHSSWHTSRNISKLVQIQRRATKFILKTMMITNNGEKKLNLLSLEQRRFSFDALFLYKALSGYINIDLSTYVQFFLDSDRFPLRGKNECTLKKNLARTNTFKFSFFNRIVDMWTHSTIACSPGNNYC